MENGPWKTDHEIQWKKMDQRNRMNEKWNMRN